MSEPLLEIERLEVFYGDVPAVRGVSLDIAPGEVVGLVGPNGAGKSTTLLATMGVETVTGGDVRLDGRSIVGSRPDQIARRGIALVPEGRHIFPNFTVEENLRLGMLGRPSMEGAARDLEWLGGVFPVIAETAGRPGGTLSGGQQQQVVIARALLGAPRVLLLDEPSLGLAPSVVDSLFDALTSIRERDVAILLVEQRAQLTVAFAERTHVMRNGEIVETLGPEDAEDTERMSRAYFG